MKIGRTQVKNIFEVSDKNKKKTNNKNPVFYNVKQMIYKWIPYPPISNPLKILLRVG